jgi:hypothetical protein
MVKFLLGDALFELQTAVIGRAIVKLFDSTFKLEIPFPPKNEGVLGITPQIKFLSSETPKRHILGQNRID